jgi:DNA primase
MCDNEDLILEILSDIFGEPEKSYGSKLQYGYNCPECGVGEKKGNLEVSLEKHVFHCWSCGDTNNMHGALGKLIRIYGNKQQVKIYKLLQPEESKPTIKKTNKITLPDSFTLFKDSNPIYPIRRQAYNYLKSRGIGDSMIEKYNIGFCDKGSFKGRIVVPSYNTKGVLNYYITRSWDPKSKVKYKNPEVEKEKIIFNEYLINWEEDIFLVEGVFDAFFLPNSIPMLGKHMSPLLFESIYSKSKGDIIIALDGDAFNDSINLYRELNGGELYGRIKLLKLPQDKDVCDLRGVINDYYYEIKN